MPLPFIAAHLLLAIGCAYAAFRMQGRRLRLFAGVTLVLLVVGGMAIERQQTWAWNAIGMGSPYLVFLTNLTLEGVGALAGLLWRTATEKQDEQEKPDRGAPHRAVVLSLLATMAAGASYVWYFLPVPANLHGVIDAKGFCPQTSTDSCSAAAAVMLLNRYHIPATEAEMAELCLTRVGHGTVPLGLFRGLWLKARSAGRHPQLMSLKGISDMSRRSIPCIISVGLRSGAPAEIAARMEEYGWEPGKFHAVTIVAADPHGQWLDVHDPTNGPEHWPAKDIEYIWDRRALVLTQD